MEKSIFAMQGKFFLCRLRTALTWQMYLAGLHCRPMEGKIAIIGMAGVFPQAADLDAYWRNILAKVDAITPLPATHWRASDYFAAERSQPDHVYVTKGGFLPSLPFDPLEFGIAPRNLPATDSAQLLGLLVTKAALEDAGYGAGRDFDRDRVSVICGVTGAQELVIPLGARLGHPHWRRALRKAGIPATTAEQIVADIAAAYVNWQESSFPGLLGNVIAGRIANRFDLHGTNCVVDAACASSLAALRLACLELRSGNCDMAISGGVDTFNDIFMYMCFARTQALAADGKAKVYDRRADGTTLGEGAGMLILKRYDDAVAADDHIYAVIRSVGSASDGRGHAIYEPSVAGQALALHNAYHGIDPTSIELLEGHGAGTRVGDQVELQALHDVFCTRGKSKWCALGSVKSQIGHTKAAAGIAGLIKAVLALYHKTLPPTINCAEPHPLLTASDSPFYLSTDSRTWPANAHHPRRAGVSSFGFGGSNFHCLLEESDVNNPRPQPHSTTKEPSNATITINGANLKVVDLSAKTTDNGNRTHGEIGGDVNAVATMETTPIPAERSNDAAVNALQEIQARSAELHAKFLDSQNLALQTLHNIVAARRNPVSSDHLVAPQAHVETPTHTEAHVPPTTMPDVAPLTENELSAPAATVPDSAKLNGHAVMANGYDDDTLRVSLLDVVAEKTGYPVAMIKMDMKIEEDLGIDSIKRVEILSALKDKHPQLETADEELLSATALGDILAFCQTEKKK